MEDNPFAGRANDPFLRSRPIGGSRSVPQLVPALEPRQRCFSIRTASTASDRRSASILVDKMYATRGYRSSALPEQDSPVLKTFLASDSGKALGTLTIRLDSTQGLHAETLFAAEVAAFRDAGLGVCEFTKLAMDRRARSPRLLASLFHAAYIFARRVHSLDRLLIEVNPRHVKYYETMLGFKVIGEVRHNERVKAPAVLMSLDLSHAEEQIEKFGGKAELSISTRSAYPYFFSPSDEVDILARMAKPGVDIAHVYDLNATDENSLAAQQDSRTQH